MESSLVVVCFSLVISGIWVCSIVLEKALRWTECGMDCLDHSMLEATFVARAQWQTTLKMGYVQQDSLEAFKITNLNDGTVKFLFEIYAVAILFFVFNSKMLGLMRINEAKKSLVPACPNGITPSIPSAPLSGRDNRPRISSFPTLTIAILYLETSRYVILLHWILPKSPE